MSETRLPAAIAAASLAFLPLFAGAPANARAAGPAAAAPSPPLRAALQRDLGLDGSRYARYLVLERQATAAQHTARQRLGDRFGGAWLERDAAGEFRLKIGATGAAPRARLGAIDADADVVAVTYPLTRLESAAARLRQPAAPPRLRAGQRPDPAIHAWYVDVAANRVVVEIDRGDAARRIANAFVAAAGVDPAMVRIVAVDGRPSTSGLRQGTLYGGDGYSDDFGLCSFGFAARRGIDTGFVTAGHCGRAGTLVFGMNGVRIGQFLSSSHPGNDYASVLLTNTTQWSLAAMVRGYRSGDQRVIGNMEVPIGGAVCRSGMASGYECGVVRARNVDINYPAGLVTGLTSTSACSDPGDSGGPYLSPSGEAQGVASGNGAMDGRTCNTVLPVSYYQPIVPALVGLNMTLLTARSCGRMNPGDVLTPGSAITSCNGTYQLTQQSDGNLVLYKLVDGGRRALWANGRFGTDFVTVMQNDGNLVTYDAAARAVWDIGKAGSFGATLFVQDDGNVVVYAPAGNWTWQTDTWRN